MSKRQLIIRPGAIGDCILSFPVLDYLKNQFAPGITEFWVPTPVVPLLQTNETVRSIASTGLDWLGLGDIPAPEPLLARLRSFDRILSWYGAERADLKASVQSLHLPFEFKPALPGREGVHATDFFAGQVGAPNGLLWRLDVPAERQRDTVVIHPFSGSSSKNWPLEKYQKLAADLPLQVDWCAGPEESLKEAVHIDNLLELAAWLKGARLYIGNDSGISHLAAATGMPVLLLFGPTDPAVWAPRGSNVTAMRWEPLRDLESSEILPRIPRLLA